MVTSMVATVTDTDAGITSTWTIHTMKHDAGSTIECMLILKLMNEKLGYELEQTLYLVVILLLS